MVDRKLSGPIAADLRCPKCGSGLRHTTGLVAFVCPGLLLKCGCCGGYWLPDEASPDIGFDASRPEGLDRLRPEIDRVDQTANTSEREDALGARSNELVGRLRAALASRLGANR
jgi:hypothetical protein